MAGEKTVLTGVTICSFSVSSKLLSSISVGASSSMRAEADRLARCCGVGNSKRGFIEERLRWRKLESPGSSVLMVSSSSRSDPSSGNLRKIFLPRLLKLISLGTCRNHLREALTRRRPSHPHVRKLL